MVRRLATAALLILLAACGPGEETATVVSTQSAPANNGDTRVAKHLFGAAQISSRQAPAPLGGYSRGCQAGAVQLPETGPTWQAMRLSRNRNWAQPVAIDYVQDLSRFAATQPGWNGLYIGDMSQPRGGPMTSGHRSHQSGLDIDIWLRPADNLRLSPQARENISSISLRRAEGAYTNGNWTQQHMNILRQAASDPRVARIFIFPGAKVAMCEAETGNRDWLRKIRPWWGHHYHFHVRLNCPPGASGCESQSPIPAGDGCADARQWVRNILNPPPPDPNAPPPRPRREITMANLPAQCTAVLTSD
ncbi:penicillin-insensitive murein endopeptidase [Aestuariibius sp. 2305UL40-4]|uniref:penicillin-insensitive murein endopeptidase n=1 Tax=Aestuariibius violaceus TaxID=3234132 RepID=UPI00345E68B7